MLRKDEAVCLRAVDYSETSQVVTLFAREHGKTDAIAKGSKRPKSKFDGPIEVFSFGDIIFLPSASAKLATLTEFNTMPVFMNLRKNLFGLNCGLFAVELLNAFTKHSDPHPVLFDSFLQFLGDVQDSKDDFNTLGLLIVFQLVLLGEFGTRPVLDKCVNCRGLFGDSRQRVCFSSIANGLVCGDCEQAFVDKMILSKDCAACLVDLKRIATVSKKVLGEVEKVLIYHFTELMGRRPRMAKSIELDDSN